MVRCSQKGVDLDFHDQSQTQIRETLTQRKVGDVGVTPTTAKLKKLKKKRRKKK